MRTVDSWFSFEGRCLLCGQKVGLCESGVGYHRHLELHRREGYLNDDLEQIKDHPIGFPGPPLGQQPCSSRTSQG